VAWKIDPKTGQEMSFSKAFPNRSEAVAFAKAQGLNASAVKSRPAGFVVEKPHKTKDEVRPVVKKRIKDGESLRHAEEEAAVNMPVEPVEVRGDRKIAKDGEVKPIPGAKDASFAKGATPREKAGLSVEQWNALPKDKRLKLIAMHKQVEPVTGAQDEESDRDEHGRFAKGSKVSHKDYPGQTGEVLQTYEAGAKRTPYSRIAWSAPGGKTTHTVFKGAEHKGLKKAQDTVEPVGRDEKLGFKKLEGKLAREKGVKDPGALAASIGRKKYGAKGMAAKAAAGRK
jgi:hypothetical protein